MTTNRKQRRAKAAVAAKVPKPKPLGPGGICCRTCPYWQVDESENLERLAVDEALCVRDPPTVHLLGNGAQPALFPSMLWWGVCGEHPEWPKR